MLRNPEGIPRLLPGAPWQHEWKLGVICLHLTDSDSTLVEEYEFLRLYRVDVESARQLVQLAQRQDRDELRFPLIELAVIRYARPFSRNFGTAIKLHRLDDGVVPAETLPLHQELIALRDNAFAHTDHAFRNPSVSRWPREDGSNRYLIGFHIANYTGLVARIPELESLMTSVEAAITARIDGMHGRLDRIPGRRGDGS